MQRIWKPEKPIGECSPACRRARLRDGPRLLLALAALSFAIVTGDVRAGELTADILRLARDFVAAFSDPEDPVALRDVFHKWDKPIVYTTRGHRNPEADAFLDTVSAELRAKANVDINRLVEGKPNVIYFFAESSYDFIERYGMYIRYFYRSDNDAERVARRVSESNVTCWYNITYGEENIGGAIVFVSNNIPNDIMRNYIMLSTKKILGMNNAKEIEDYQRLPQKFFVFRS